MTVSLNSLPGTFSISLVFLWAFFLFLHVGHIFLSLHFARYSVCSNALEEGAASPSREKAASVRTACGVVWQAGCGWVGARSARGATQPECVPGGRTPPAGCSGVRLTFPLSPSGPSAPSLSWVLISKEEFCDFVFLSPFLPRAQVRRKALQEEIDRESGKTETSETRKLTVSLMLELCKVTLSSLDASPRHLAA